MIIPTINCRDFSSASKHIRLAERFLPPLTGWIHIDVSDGKFSDTVSWGDPAEFATLEVRLNVEVHLMVENPQEGARPWLKVGVKRLIIPVQAVKDIKSLVKEAKKYKAEVVPSFDMNVSIEEVLEYSKTFDIVHFLAVNPGLSGQKFNPETLSRIEFLRGENRGVKIEVDGGINPEVAVQALSAGADVLVSGSYIFNSPDLEEAYRELRSFL